LGGIRGRIMHRKSILVLVAGKAMAWLVSQLHVPAARMIASLEAMAHLHCWGKGRESSALGLVWDMAFYAHSSGSDASTDGWYFLPEHLKGVGDWWRLTACPWHGTAGYFGLAGDDLSYAGSYIALGPVFPCGAS